jgi:hypothetical protein
LDIGPVGLRLLDQRDHAPEGGVRAYVRSADLQVAEARDRRGIDIRAGAYFRRHGFARDGCLVHGGLPVQHLAIHGDLLAGADDDDLARADLADRKLDFDPVAQDARRGRGHGGKVLQRATGASGGEALHRVADAHEEDHYQRCRPLAYCQRGDHAQGHQRVGDDLASQGCSHDVAEDRITRRDHQRQPDVPGHPAGDLLEQAQPFADDHHKKDDAEQHAKQQQDPPPVLYAQLLKCLSLAG